MACLLFVIDHNWDASIEAFARLDRQLAGSLEAVQGGSPERRVAYFLFALLGVGLALGRGARPLRVHGAAAYAMLAFLGWAFLSLLWSLSPQLTVRRGGVVVMLSVGIAGLLRRFSLREILGLLLFLSLAYLLVGVMAELSLGTFEPLGRHYRFAGTLHPNIQGVNCALAFLAGLWLATAPEEPWNRRWIGVLAVAVAGLFLLLTRSRGAVGSALAAAGVLGLLRLRRRHAALAVAAGIGLAGVAGFLLAAELAEEPWGLILLGRDPTKAGTLTGRIPLWDSLLRYAGEHPVLGYGYGAFIDPERGSAVATEVGAFVLGGPHSAYISVLGDLGAIGLLLFVAALVFSLVRALRHHSSGEWNP
ncbi:MAG TPA: O-antigen ligase family protein, partial [Longimicrobiales bacterium]|nr:O-antigen ligase family protein [Longimicrobiales bacterium]